MHKLPKKARGDFFPYTIKNISVILLSMSRISNHMLRAPEDPIKLDSI